MATIPAGTVDRWWEYFKLEPWGDDWERTSLLTSTLVNVANSMAPRGESEEAPEFIPPDAFMPYSERKPERNQLVEQTIEGLEGLRGL
jgi:hypothetical protein